MSELLSSEVYNPSLDKTTTDLYKLMVAEEPDQLLIDDYIEMVTSMTSQNPYKGVLENPRKCEISDAYTGITDIIKDLNDRYTEISVGGTYTPGYTVHNPNYDPTYTGPVDPTDQYNPLNEYITVDAYNPSEDDKATLNDWTLGYPGLLGDFTYTQNALTDYENHTDRTVANLPSIVGMMQSDIGNSSAVSGLGGNPCIPFADVLGSILQAGQKIMNQIIGMIGQIKNMIMQPLQMIQALAAQMMGMVSKMIEQMKAEIMKMAMAMLNMAKMGLAQLMQFLPNDPCLKSMIGGMITGKASKILGGILG